MPKKQRNQRRRRGPRAGLGRLNPQLLCSRTLGEIIAGATTSIMRPAAIPVSRSFRLHWVEVEFSVVQAVPTSATNPFIWFPAMVEVATYSAAGQRVARTGPFLVGSGVRRIRLNHPRNEDWYPYDLSTPVFAIDGICVDKRLSGHTIAWYTSAAYFSVSTPDASEACPTLVVSTSAGPSIFEVV